LYIYNHDNSTTFEGKISALGTFTSIYIDHTIDLSKVTDFAKDTNIEIGYRSYHTYDEETNQITSIEIVPASIITPNEDCVISINDLYGHEVTLGNDASYTVAFDSMSSMYRNAQYNSIDDHYFSEFIAPTKITGFTANDTVQFRHYYYSDESSEGVVAFDGSQSVSYNNAVFNSVATLTEDKAGILALFEEFNGQNPAKMAVEPNSENGFMYVEALRSNQTANDGAADCNIWWVHTEYDMDAQQWQPLDVLLVGTIDGTGITMDSFTLTEPA
ncbi:MAG: hypothetical protein J5846_06515, partial [Desulfovibrio sp.]|nr:hypothetical protein [Desulfovibrio sp.]